MVDVDADVAVVGLGAWGSATLWRLAQRGADVLGLERFEPGHSLGSSHGGSRMFRLTCYEHPDLVPLAELSLRLWSELEAATPVPLVYRSGGLMIGSPDGRMISGTLANAREFGIEVECLGVAELARRFPQQTGVAPDHVGVWEPSAGLLRPEEAVKAAIDAAVRCGARVHTDTRVTALERVAGGVVLRTSTQEFRVHQAVVAVGSWSSTLVPQLPLKIVRRPITWFRPVAAPEDFSLEKFPMFKRECPGGLVLWGCGRFLGDDVKLGLEATRGLAPPEIDPDILDRSTTAEDWERLAEVVKKAVPGIRAIPVRASVCMATQTPDGQFVLGRLGKDAPLIVAAGDNSQGFKHATGIGEVLADIAVGEPPAVAVDFADPDRFG